MNLSPFLLLQLEWVYGNAVLCLVFLLGPNASHGLEPGDVVREQDEDHSPPCEQDLHSSTNDGQTRAVVHTTTSLVNISELLHCV